MGVAEQCAEHESMAPQSKDLQKSVRGQGRTYEHTMLPSTTEGPVTALTADNQPFTNAFEMKRELRLLFSFLLCDLSHTAA